jgi:His-Xaa-Ser system protein HxsD
VEIDLDKSIYSERAIQSAAYRCASDVTCVISPSGRDLLSVKLTLKDASKLERPVLDYFMDILGDEVLKARVQEETSQLRELLIAHAFSNAVRTDSE